MSLRCGDSRCVGADTTCAGAWELALPCTAVVLFSVCIITYMSTCVNGQIVHKIFGKVVYIIHVDMLSVLRYNDFQKGM